MGVLSVNVRIPGRTVAQTKDKTTYAATYRAKLDSASTSDFEILSDYRIPFYGKPYDGDPRAVCKAKNLSRLSDSTLFCDIDVAWETPDKPDDNEDDKPKADDNGNPTDNPFDWRDKVQWIGAKFTKPAEDAIVRTDKISRFRPLNGRGKPINAAGDVYDPPIEIDDSRGILRITKYLQEFPGDVERDYRDAVNSDEVAIIKKGFNRIFERFTLKMEPLQGQLLYHRQANGREIAYWETVYELAVNWGGWRFNINNVGINESQWDGDTDDAGNALALDSSGRLVYRDFDKIYTGPFAKRMKDPDGRPITVPQPLDFNGRPLAKNQPITTILYSLYTNERPFAPLNL